MRVQAAAPERIHWPEYLVCVMTLAHHVDVHTYAREGRLCCVDCRIDLARARSWPWRVLEWLLLAALAGVIGGALLVGAWLLQ